MGQVEQWVRCIKKLLKLQGKTYRDLAFHLAISEASVKRIFSSSKVSFDRIELICDYLGYELADIAKMVAQSGAIATLTEEQETQVVDDPVLLLIATCVVNNWQVDDIMFYYNFSIHDCLRKLIQLEKLKIIKLLGNNQYKLNISPNFAWIPDGPIQKFFQSHIQDDFLNSDFNEPNATLQFRFGMLTTDGIQLLQKKLDKLLTDFIAETQSLKFVSPKERTGSAIIIALRPWTPALFDQYKNEGVNI